MSLRNEIPKNLGYDIVATSQVVQYDPLLQKEPLEKFVRFPMSPSGGIRP